MSIQFSDILFVDDNIICMYVIEIINNLNPILLAIIHILIFCFFSLPQKYNIIVNIVIVWKVGEWWNTFQIHL